jgi:signal transduction histidine kinase
VNLIENAIQHSPQKGRNLEAQINDVIRSGSVCNQDPGGILAEDLPKISSRSSRNARRHRTRLAIAQRIMQEHGGKLIAGNNPEASSV